MEFLNQPGIRQGLEVVSISCSLGACFPAPFNSPSCLRVPLSDSTGEGAGQMDFKCESQEGGATRSELWIYIYWALIKGHVKFTLSSYSLCGFLDAMYTNILRHASVVSCHELASLGLFKLCSSLNPANIILVGTVHFANQVQWSYLSAQCNLIRARGRLCTWEVVACFSSCACPLVPMFSPKWTLKKVWIHMVMSP